MTQLNQKDWLLWKAYYTRIGYHCRKCLMENIVGKFLRTIKANDSNTICFPYVKWGYKDQ